MSRAMTRHPALPTICPTISSERRWRSGRTVGESRPFLVLGRKPLLGGRHEPWQRREVVAALEYGSQARCECGAAPGELAEAVLGDEHLPERILAVGVEARGDEHQVGIKRPHGPLDLLEGSAVLVIPRAGGQRHVQ